MNKVKLRTHGLESIPLPVPTMYNSANPYHQDFTTLGVSSQNESLEVCRSVTEFHFQNYSPTKVPVPCWTVGKGLIFFCSLWYLISDGLPGRPNGKIGQIEDQAKHKKMVSLRKPPAWERAHKKKIYLQKWRITWAFQPALVTVIEDWMAFCRWYYSIPSLKWENTAIFQTYHGGVFIICQIPFSSFIMR